MSSNDDHADNHGYFIGSLQAHQDEEHFSSSVAGRPLAVGSDAGRGFNASTVEYFNSGRMPAAASPWELELNWTRADELMYPNNRSSSTSVDNQHLLSVNNLEGKYSFSSIQDVPEHHPAANYNAVYGSLIRGSDDSYMNDDEPWLDRAVGSTDLQMHASNSGSSRQGRCGTVNNSIINVHQLAGWQGRGLSASSHDALCAQSWYMAAAPAGSGRADRSTGHEQQQQVRLGLDIHQSNQMTGGYGGHGQHVAGSGAAGEDLYNLKPRAEDMAGGQLDRPLYNLVRRSAGAAEPSTGRLGSAHVAMSKSKDRHSKVRTARGMRDRRVRLSVGTALQFYDIMDRLGLQQPSKAMDWLMLKAKDSIDDLPAGGPHHQDPARNHSNSTIVAAAPAAAPSSTNDDSNTNNCIVALEPPPLPAPDHVDVAMPPSAPSPPSSNSSSTSQSSS